MRWLELVNMEYGDCTVLGAGDGSILMVDWGSVNRKLREGDVPLDRWHEAVAARYEAAPQRAFLLTHFHRDHLSGFRAAVNRREGYFHRVYLPRSPLDSRGRPLLVEYALFCRLFSPPQSDAFQVNTWCVEAFRELADRLGADRIFTLGRGDRFRFDGVEYQVLWPQVEAYPFGPALEEALERWNTLFSSPFQPPCAREFLTWKEEFLGQYAACGAAFSAGGRALPEQRRACLERMETALGALEGLQGELARLPQAHDIREDLAAPWNSAAYAAAANGASVVFHNLRQGGPSCQDVLFPGDAGPETFSAIAGDLYDGYYVLKAPHHGTDSGVSPLFSDMSFAHILLSNGEYHAGGGVAQAYLDRPDSLRHCTGAGACRWFSTTGACCNRLSLCYEQRTGQGLALKCADAAAPRGKTPPCLIRVVGPRGRQGCFCDAAPFPAADL